MYLDLTKRQVHTTTKLRASRLNKTFLSFFFQDTSQEELTKFFLRFKGPNALRKRVYRFATSDDDWQFTGGVFVNFDCRENAEEFLKLFSETKLSYNGDGKRVITLFARMF